MYFTICSAITFICSCSDCNREWLITPRDGEASMNNAQNVMPEYDNIILHEYVTGNSFLLKPTHLLVISFL